MRQKKNRKSGALLDVEEDAGPVGLARHRGPLLPVLDLDGEEVEGGAPGDAGRRQVGAGAPAATSRASAQRG